MNWTDTKEQLPDKRGNYLCVLDTWGRKHMEVLSFTLNLQEYDELDFKGASGAGFYDYDSEYGYFQRNNVTHWMPLPALP